MPIGIIVRIGYVQGVCFDVVVCNRVGVVLRERRCHQQIIGPNTCDDTVAERGVRWHTIFAQVVDIYSRNIFSWRGLNAYVG